MADRLYAESPRFGSAQRHDRVEVADVPALLQHVDVDHDLRGFGCALDPQQPFNRLILIHA